MSGTSTKSRKVTFWLSNEAYAEYKRLVVTSPKNPHDSPELMIKAVAEWYPFRHSTRKFRRKESYEV